jgi:hypothetical protein
LYDDLGTEVSIVVDDDKNTSVNDAALSLAQWRYVKFRSGTSGTPVTQTAARTINLVLKG